MKTIPPDRARTNNDGDNMMEYEDKEFEHKIQYVI